MNEAARLIQHADAMLLQAFALGAEERAAVTAEALDCLIRAERLEPGSASWLLARICAEEGDPDRCRRWLERAARYGRLPTASDVAAHPAMARVRTQSWFKGLIGVANS